MNRTRTPLAFLLLTAAFTLLFGCSSKVVVGRTSPKPPGETRTTASQSPDEAIPREPGAAAGEEHGAAAGEEPAASETPEARPEIRSEPVVSQSLDEPEAQVVKPPTVVPRSTTRELPEDEIEPRYELDLTIGGFGMSEGYFDTPVAICVDEEESIYVLDQANHRIQCFDRYGDFQFEWGRQGSGAGEYAVSDVDGLPTLRMTGEFEFNMPADMILDADDRWDLNRITVADSLNHRIQRFVVVRDVFDTLPEEVFVMLPKGGAAIFPDTELFDRYESEETKVIIDPVFLDERKADNFMLRPFTWGGLGYSEGLFNRPTGLSMGEDGFLYVADTMNERVQAFFVTPFDPGSDMRYYIQMGRDIDLPYGEGRLSGPVAVAYDNSDFGGVYVLDVQRAGGYLIQRFNRNGEFVSVHRLKGGESTALRYPVDIAVNPFDNTMFITDKGHRAVMVYNNKGEFMFSIGGGELKDPRGLAVLRNGYVYVTDAATHMVYRYIPR